MRAIKNRAHKVDLAGLQALWAANYLGIRQLLPQLSSGDSSSFAMDVPGDRAVSIRVLQRGPYTTFLELDQAPDGGGYGVHFQLRIYHDARLAEVIAYQDHHYFKPHYDYPNSRMYHPDEKYQVNRLFGEWLQYHLASGRPVRAVTEPSYGS